MRRIGFTGTHLGMTGEQRTVIQSLLLPANIEVEVHHGDCVGSDAEFHEMATGVGFRTVAHPPLNPKLRAFCVADLVLPEKDYLDRDRDIVNVTDVLLATPRQMTEQKRGGTWHTVRYARFKQPGREVIVVLPDGTIQ